MLKYLFCIATLLTSIHCFGQFKQFQNNNWYFGRNATMSFPNANSPVVGPATSQLSTDEGSASISDIDGNLLFYTDGGTVWDANDNVMPNGSQIQGYGYGGSSTQSCIILQKTTTNLYYIFTVAESGNIPHKFSYTIVNMALNGGLGDVVVASKNVLISDSTTEKIAATYDCTTTSRTFVLTHEFGSNKFISRALTATGLGAAITTAIGPVINNSGAGSDQGVGSMKFSVDGKKIAICNNTNPASLDLYDFNKSTGAVSNRLDLYDVVAADDFYGLEFSPNNRYLYVTNGDNVSQYDISSGVAATIKSSRIVIGTPVSGAIAVRQLQLAPDGKIYCAQTKTSTFLGIINNPNVAGSGCNWDAVGFDVDPDGNGFSPRFGLPSQLIIEPTKFTYQGAPEGITICKSNSSPVVSPTMLSSFPVNNGVFSTDDPVGLIINSVTGAIDVAASTIGTYAVEFTAPLSGCSTPFYYDYTVDLIDCYDVCKVQNHSFEFTPDWGYTNWQPGFTGAETDSTEINQLGVYTGTPSLTMVAEVDAKVWLQQAISGFVIGNSYELTFYASRRIGPGANSPNPTTINVKIDGGALTTTATRTNTTFALTTQSYNFVATQTTHVLSLRPNAVVFPTTAPQYLYGMIIDDIDICPLIVLPIELITFNGHLEGDHSKLYWQTATEINNDYFILEKSADGIVWRDIAKIDGAGNSTQINNYSFNDYELLPEIMYYRLKQVDFDGKKTYSQIVAIQYTNNNINTSIFPNPSNGVFTINTNSTILSYDITDNLGQLVHAGTSSLFDISMLADGVYFIKIKLNNEIVIKKIIKCK